MEAGQVSLEWRSTALNLSGGKGVFNLWRVFGILPFAVPRKSAPALLLKSTSTSLCVALLQRWLDTMKMTMSAIMTVRIGDSFTEYTLQYVKLPHSAWNYWPTDNEFITCLWQIWNLISLSAADPLTVRLLRTCEGLLCKLWNIVLSQCVHVQYMTVKMELVYRAP